MESSINDTKRSAGKTFVYTLNIKRRRRRTDVMIDLIELFIFMRFVNVHLNPKFVAG